MANTVQNCEKGWCRKIEQRQIGERCRVEGNALFKAGRWTEAYQAYDRGLGSDKHNMALHANAALCSLKMACNVQAIEHADKVGLLHRQTLLDLVKNIPLQLSIFKLDAFVSGVCAKRIYHGLPLNAGHITGLAFSND